MTRSAIRPAAWLAAGLLLAGLCGASIATASSSPADSPPLVLYRHPVDGPVDDPFRPPGHVGAPGNRGLQYGNAPWVPVVAAADGVVRFSGTVFGSLTLTVQHDDGVVTTYNGMSELWADAGLPVTQGDGLGLAGTRVHFGARLGSHYLDPQLLIDASASGPARLIPVENP